MASSKKFRRDLHQLSPEPIRGQCAGQTRRRQSLRPLGLLIAVLYVQCKPGSCPRGSGAAPWLWREASVASYVRNSYNAKDNIMSAAASCSAIKELCPSGESTVPCLKRGKKRHAEGGPKSFRLRKPGHFHVGRCLMAATSSGLWVGSHVLTFLDADAAGGLIC